MDGQNLIRQAVELMLLGMGTVYVFLILLVFCTGLMSRVLARLTPEAPASSSQPQSPPPAQGTADATLRAAIVAAIHEHRSKS
jgi:oxaloacetate decarboxylase gamma subunit